jgi:hypothetical protein
MELSIIKQLKELRQIAKRKPKCIVEKVKKTKPTKPKQKHEPLKAVVDGRELSLSRIAQLYNLEPHTVYARYRVGNRGKLLIRPSNRTPKPT